MRCHRAFLINRQSTVMPRFGVSAFVLILVVSVMHADPCWAEPDEISIRFTRDAEGVIKLVPSEISVPSHDESGAPETSRLVFNLVNETGQSLEFDRVRTSCGCTVHAEMPSIMMPADVVPVALEFSNRRGRARPARSTISYILESPAPQVLRLVVASHSTDSNYETTLAAADSEVAEYRIRAFGEASFQILGVDPPVSASSMSAGLESAYTLRLDREKWAESGSPAMIEVRVGGSDPRDLRLSVPEIWLSDLVRQSDPGQVGVEEAGCGAAADLVQVVPRSFDLGQVSSGAPKLLTIRLRRLEPRPGIEPAVLLPDDRIVARLHSWRFDEGGLVLRLFVEYEGADNLQTAFRIQYGASEARVPVRLHGGE